MWVRRKIMGFRLISCKWMKKFSFFQTTSILNWVQLFSSPCKHKSRVLEKSWMFCVTSLVHFVIFKNNLLLQTWLTFHCIHCAVMTSSRRLQILSDSQKCWMFSKRNQNSFFWSCHFPAWLNPNVFWSRKKHVKQTSRPNPQPEGERTLVGLYSPAAQWMCGWLAATSHICMI